MTFLNRPKNEIWFDNVDEIFIEASVNRTDETSTANKPSNTLQKSHPKKGDKKVSAADTEAHLVKPGSFEG